MLSKETDIVEVITFIRQLKAFFRMKRKKGNLTMLSQITAASKFLDIDQQTSSDDSES